MSPRLRPVRCSYPQELMQLAIVLAEGRRKREVAALIGVPLSTLYRWLKSHPRGPAFDAKRGSDNLLCELIGACEMQGVRVAKQLANEAGSARCGTRLQQLAAPSGAAMREPMPQTGARGVDPAARHAGAVSGEIRRRLQLVRDKIDREYFTHLGCDEFGRIAAMSKYNLINRCKRVYGVSPYRYLLRVRIRHARKLLGSTPASLGAIATAVGFDSQSCLSKSFRSIEGISLSQFCRGMRAPAAGNLVRETHRSIPDHAPAQAM